MTKQWHMLLLSDTEASKLFEMLRQELFYNPNPDNRDVDLDFVWQKLEPIVGDIQRKGSDVQLRDPSGQSIEVPVVRVTDWNSTTCP